MGGDHSVVDLERGRRRQFEIDRTSTRLLPGSLKLGKAGNQQVVLRVTIFAVMYASVAVRHRAITQRGSSGPPSLNRLV
jgi:hypothetical protein